MVRKTVLMLSAILLMGTMAYAADCPVCGKAAGSNGNWPQRSANQMLQGLSNVGFGLFEVFSEPMREVRENPNPDLGYKIGNGALKGWGTAMGAFGGGILEVLTFWTPVRIIPNTTCAVCRSEIKTAIGNIVD